MVAYGYEVILEAESDTIHNSESGNSSVKPTNQFDVEVSISFPQGDAGNAVMRWFNLQNCGKETIPLNKKASKKHVERAYRLHACRRYTFVFQVSAEGDWMFVGRKET